MSATPKQSAAAEIDAIPVSMRRGRILGALAGSSELRTTLRVTLAVVLAFALTAVLIAISGKNPLVAYWVLLKGALGSTDRIAFALNRSTPYILAGVGIALCFRAKVINIGAEGQIAVGGLAAASAALFFAHLPLVVIPAALAAGALCGAAGLPQYRLKRGV